jgi:glutathione synthase
MLFVVDPLDGLLPAHDTSVALMEAAQADGHEVLATTMRELSVVDGGAVARAVRVQVDPCRVVDGRFVAPQQWCSTEPAGDVALADVDVVLVRTDPPVDADYLRGTYVLDAARAPRTLLVNDPRGLREVNEKLYTLRYPDLIPETVVRADLHGLRDTVERWGRAVLKPTDAMAGRGILLLRGDDPNLGSLLELSTGRGRSHVILQRFVPEAVDGDRRVVVVDGEPVGAIRRVAAGTEFRCNMAAGATVLPDAVTSRDKEICDVLAPDLRALGIVLAGLDVIGDRLTEVNVTSPTGAREIEALTGAPVARVVVERIVDLHARRAR